jgi:fructose 5-dehydrogenase cytochrome subunit
MQTMSRMGVAVRSGLVSLIAALGLHGGFALAQNTPPADGDLIARGRYLATAADCAGCHSAPGGKPMAGGLPIDSPFGQIFSSNITPSKTNGIGNYTEAQFARALREGVDANGTHLYPAMPYTSYAGIGDDDVRALYAYFMHGVEPVDAATPATQLSFPFSQRWLMMGWNLLFLDNKRFEPVAGQSDAINRGRYLVNVLGHCSACHTPRNFAMAEKPSLALSGGQVGPWRTPNITSDMISGIGGWTQEELVQYLRTGAVAGKGQAAGGMAEAVEHSLQYLSDADLGAIAAYLKATRPIRSPSDTQPAYTYRGSGNAYEPSLRAVNQGIGYGKPGAGYPALTTGAELYSGNCASCHQTNGGGTQDEAFPGLTHNSTLGRDNADNLVMVILNGLHISTGNTDRLMPGFADELNDEQIAKLATFVMSEYGNPHVQVSAERVAKLRAGGDSPIDALRFAMAAGVLIAAVIVVGAIWRLRRRRARATGKVAQKEGASVE